MKKLLIAIALFAGLSVEASENKKQRSKWVDPEGGSSKKSTSSTPVSENNPPRHFKAKQPWHQRHSKKLIGGAALTIAAVSAYLYRDNLQERIRNLGVGTWAEKGVDYLGKPVEWLHSGFKNAMSGMNSWYTNYFGKSKTDQSPAIGTTRRQDELQWEQDAQVRLDNLGMKIGKLEYEVKNIPSRNFYANTSGSQELRQKKDELAKTKRQYEETTSALNWRRGKRIDNESMEEEIDKYWNKK